MQRLLVRLIKRFAKRRHKTPTRRVAAEFGEIDHADERFACDHAAERRAHLAGDRHICMTPAEYHDRIASGTAVGAGAQSPLDAERVHDRHARAAIEQPLDKTFRGISLARAGGAHNRDAVIERRRAEYRWRPVLPRRNARGFPGQRPPRAPV
jgi:hypothetical protein